MKRLAIVTLALLLATPAHAKTVYLPMVKQGPQYLSGLIFWPFVDQTPRWRQYDKAQPTRAACEAVIDKLTKTPEWYQIVLWDCAEENIP